MFKKYPIGTLVASKRSDMKMTISGPKKCRISASHAVLFASLFVCVFLAAELNPGMARADEDWDNSAQSGLAQGIQETADDMGIIQEVLTPPVMTCLAPLPPVTGPSSPAPAEPVANIDLNNAPSPSGITPQNALSLANIDSTYANNPQIRRMINYAWDHHSAVTQGECYHAVKQALYAAHIVPKGSLPGDYASAAMPDLAKQGFVNLLDIPGYQNLATHPEQAPVGAIVVYSGSDRYDWSKYGDVQIHMANGEWISDYYSRNAMLRQTTYRDGVAYPDKDYFHVVGVMVDPKLEKAVIAAPANVRTPAPPTQRAMAPLAPKPHKIDRVGVEPVLASYDTNPQVLSMVGYAERHKRPRFNPRDPKCYHYVKQALYAAHMVPYGSLKSDKAYDAVPDLARQGFVNLLDTHPELKNTPEAAPVGAIVVYAGNPHYHFSRDGDVQIHTADGWVSDYFSRNAMIRQRGYNGVYDRNYFHVIGVMVDPKQQAPADLANL
jgi:hypothetical protein